MTPSLTPDLARRALDKVYAQTKLVKQRQESADRCRALFRNFVAEAWHVVEPAKEFMPAWHIDAIADHAQAVDEGHIQNLLITVPPGSAKSILISVMFPAWVWTRKPGWRSTFASYDSGLSTRDSVRCRGLLESSWYLDTFQPQWKFASDQNEKTYYANTLKGFRVSTSVGGRGTGWRGDAIICDDALNASDQFSDAALEEVWFWWSNVMFNRLNDMKTGARIAIMQRLNDRDLAGQWLRTGEPTHLLIPMEYDPTRSKVTVLSNSPYREWRDPRTVRDELMFPALFPREVVDGIKKNPAAWAGQYQQTPNVEGGGILKSHKWNYWQPSGAGLPVVRVRLPDGKIEERRAAELPDTFDLQLQSWDCLDSETEILSYGGWKGKGEISVGDLVYSLDIDSGLLELVPATECGERPLRENERFVRISSIQADVRVTEGHNLFVGIMHKRNKTKGYDVGLMPAKDLASKMRPYRLQVSGKFEHPGVKLSDDELRLIAWFITDGGFVNQYFQISQTKEYKHEIRALLGRLDLDFRELIVNNKTGFANGKPATRFLIPKGTKTGKYLRRGWSYISRWLDKNLSPDLLLMTGEQFEVFWTELMKGDGDLSNGYLCTARKPVADRLQHMAVTRGFASSMHSRPSPTGTIIWYVSAKPRQWRQSNPNVKAASRLSFESPIHRETVWCVQNCNSTIVTRRHGKVTIVGNCSFKDLKTSDFVVGQTIGVCGANRYILHQIRDRMNLPATISAVRKMTGLYPKAHLKLVEDKANGSAVIQMLHDEISGLVPVSPQDGKVSRASAASVELESGNWFLPHPMMADWVGDPENPTVSGFLAETVMFPNGQNDDAVDAWSQAALRIQSEKIGGVFGVTEQHIRVDPFEYAEKWPRLYGLSVNFREIGAVWLIRKPDTGEHYLYAEYGVPLSDPAQHATEIRKQGDWITGYMTAEDTGRDKRDGLAMANKFRSMGLKIEAIQDSSETMLLDVQEGLQQGKLKIFGNLATFFDQYRMFRRNDKHKLPEYNCAVIWAMCIAWKARSKVRGPVEQKPQGRQMFRSELGSNGWMGS